jgi:hypothetical protein
LLVIDNILRLVSIQAFDAALRVEPRLAHVRSVHGTKSAFSAAPANCKYRIISRFDQLHPAASFHYLAEHLMAQHQIFMGRGCLGATTCGLGAVSATDADP